MNELIGVNSEPGFVSYRIRVLIFAITSLTFLLSILITIVFLVVTLIKRKKLLYVLIPGTFSVLSGLGLLLSFFWITDYSSATWEDEPGCVACFVDPESQACQNYTETGIWTEACLCGKSFEQMKSIKPSDCP